MAKILLIHRLIGPIGLSCVFIICMGTVTAQKTSKLPQKAPAAQIVKSITYIELIEKDKATLKEYDPITKKITKEKEFDPGKEIQGCGVIGLPEDNFICFFGSGQFTTTGVALAVGTVFYQQPEKIKVQATDNADNEIYVLRYYIAMEKCIRPYPFAFVVWKNDIANKVYFKTDSQNRVIDWGLEVKGKMISLPLTIPKQLAKYLADPTNCQIPRPA